MVVFVENTMTFSIIAGPFSSLILLAAGAGTLVARSTTSTDSLTRQDWFWIAIGFIIFYGVETGLPPLAVYLLRSRPDLATAAYQVKAITMAAAMLLVAWGMICPTLRHQSGGSSSPSASPSLSSPSPLG
jgi:hypothetical protein